MSVARLLCLAAVLVACAMPALGETAPAEVARQEALNGDLQKALRDLEQLAEAGDATAQLYLGMMLAAGQGTAVDQVSAVEWWRRAADQNLAEAQFRLGAAYGAGAGVPVDAVEAAKWFMLAGAEDGIAFALISESLTEAQIEEAQDRAKRWLQDNQRARLRDAMALNELSDGPRKTQLLTALADEGVASAQFELGLLYQRGIPDAVRPRPKAGIPNFLLFPEPRPDEARAVRYFRLAAQQSYVPAWIALADALSAGRGVERDREEAMRLYERAAERGNSGGKLGLALMLVNGKAKGVDWARALMLFSEVAAEGPLRYETQAELAEIILQGPSPNILLAYMWYAVAANGARSDGMDLFADSYDQARLRLEPMMSDRQINQAREMAGRCVSSNYARCREPEFIDGILDLFGI